MRAALLLVLAAPLGAHRPAEPSPRTAVVAPAVDPRAAPAVGRCTSDGACTSVGEDGVVRRAARVRYGG